jgi:hypothetical protein
MAVNRCHVQPKAWWLSILNVMESDFHTQKSHPVGRILNSDGSNACGGLPGLALKERPS